MGHAVTTALLALVICIGLVCASDVASQWPSPLAPTIEPIGFIAIPAAAASPDADGDGVPDTRDQCPEALAGASGTDDNGCPTSFDPYVDLSFDDDMHQSWYRRYWTGDCGDLPFLSTLFSEKSSPCVSGEPQWCEVIDETIERAPANDRSRLRYKLWHLGRLVGHEWARDNRTRLIESDDVVGWGERLRDAENVEGVVDTIRAEAEAKLR